MAKKPDIELLYGVLGGGSVSGQSGSTIRGQLEEIVRGLNSSANVKRRGILLGLDRQGTKSAFTGELKEILGGLSGQKQFKLKISKIDATAAINDVRRQLQEMLGALSVKNGVNVGGLSGFLGAGGAASVRQTNAELDDTVARMKVLDTISRSVANAYTGGLSGRSAITDSEALNRVTESYNSWQQRVEAVKASRSALSAEEIAALQREGTALAQKIAELKRAQTAAEKAGAAEAAAAKKAAAAEEKNSVSLKQVLTLHKQIESFMKNNPKSIGTDGYKTLGAIKGELMAVADQARAGRKELGAMAGTQFRNLQSQFISITANLQAAGKAGKTLGDWMKAAYEKFGGWMFITRSLMAAIRMVRKMVSAVVDIDKAMTELRKVTDETDGTYIRFLDKAVSRAKTLGATVADTVNASADFARLGYSMEDASTLADAALVYKNVGDGIENINEASESVISTMRAFHIEAKDSMGIVDKFNEVGNNFAISSKGVGDALMRSASALASANNTLDESIALVTAANSVVQDADKVGTALKTVSMFLRAAKTDAEEAGESTEGMADSVSELRGELLALTGGRVDIQLDEDTFKSTYQILKELSAVWGSLTDITQANILEKIGGKRNSNVVSSLISNFSTAEEAIKTAANAAGSALAENEKYLDSIAGKLSVFQAAFEALSMDLFGSDTVKVVVDLGTALVSVMSILAKINLLLPAIIAAVVTIRSVRMARMATEGAQAIASLVTRLVAEKVATDELTAAYHALNFAQKKELASKLEAAVAAKTLTKEEYAQIAAKLGLASATTGAKAATDGLNLSIKGLLASNPIGWAVLAISLIPSLIGWLSGLHKSNEELIRDGEEIRQTYTNSLSEAAGNLSTLHGLEDEFKRLSRGVDDYGNNVSLAADDYERYREIVQTILGISPSLISGYDAEGAAIAQKNGLLEKSISLMEDEQRLKMREFVSDENLVKAWNGTLAKIQEFQAENPLSMQGELVDGVVHDFGEAMQAAAGSGQTENYEIFSAFGLKDKWSDFARSNGRQVMGLVTEHYAEIADQILHERQTLTDVFTQAELDELTKLALKHQENVERYQERIDQYALELNPVLQYVPQTITAYGELSDRQKEFLTRYINTFRVTADTTEDEILRMKQDILDFTDFLDGNDGLEDTIAIGISLESGKDKDGKELAVADYKRLLEEFQQSIDALDEDTQVKIRATFGIEEDEDRLNQDVDAAIRHVENLLMSSQDAKKELAQIGQDMQDEFGDGNVDLTARVRVENEDGSYSTVASEWFNENIGGQDVAIHLTPIVDGEFLDGEELDSYINDLLDGAESASDILERDKTGKGGLGIILRTKVGFDFDYEENWDQRLHEIQEKFYGLKAEIESGRLDMSPEELVDELAVNDVLKIYYNISADPNSLTFEELQDMLEKLGVDWGNIVDVWDFAPLADDIGSLEGKFKNLISSMDTLRSGTALTVGELAKLALEYPELLKVSNLFADTSIENQQAMLDAVLGTYESEYDALLDTKIAELEATNQLMQDQITLENEKKNKVVEIADLQSNGKLDSEEEYQRILDQLHDLEGENYVTFSDGVLNVNQDMLKKELEQTGDKVEESRPLFEAQGDLIAESNSKGLSEALKAWPKYGRAIADWAGTSLRQILTNVGNAIPRWLSGDFNTGSLLADVGGLDTISINAIQLETEVEGGYTIDGKSVDDWSAEYQDTIDKRVSTITEQIEANKVIIDNLKKLKGLDLESLYGSDGKPGKKVEEYIADIDKYREAIERLNRIQIHKADLELKLSNADGLEKQIELQKQLMGVYEGEQAALHTLNDLRDNTITNGADTLRQIGFNVEYDPEKNRFFVENMEHLNELVADSRGDYETMDDATNALRKDTESLIKTLEDLNKDNQEGSDSWMELHYAIREAKIAIVSDLKEIVSRASEAVDTIQDVYDTLKSAADEYAANDGFISVDAFQAIVELGPEYMQYLRDENGLLIINEERIQAVIAAKTQQLALDNAMSYVERLRLALQKDSIEDLDQLLTATIQASDATWGLVYANLGLLDLNSKQYDAALHNINAIRSLADAAVSGIGKTAGALEDNLNNMKDGMDDILKYVMDMLKQRIQDQIDALEEEKTAYAELIALKKESLQAAKDEENYQKSVADKVKEIAKLQARIDALSLDNSRDAQAKKAQLLEEMNKLQEELAQQQADHALDKQTESLDKMQEAYEDEKDGEIKKLEDSISSYQKLYDKAIAYIQEHWGELEDELIAWNYEYGDVLETEITDAWDNCLAAAQRYGSYVAALEGVKSGLSGLDGSDGDSGHTIVGGSGDYGDAHSNEDGIRAAVREMRTNAQAYSSASDAERERMSKRNLYLGNQLAQYGVNAVRGGDGVWYIDRVGGEKLFEKYRYHSGGIAGNGGTLRENELMAKLEKGEPVVSNGAKGTLFSLIDFVSALSKRLDTSSLPVMDFSATASAIEKGSIPAGERAVSVQFGDVYISGGGEETVRAHREVNREFVDEVLGLLNVKR